MEPIKDEYFWIIGWIDTKPNGDKVAMDFHHRILGYYEKSRNITTDFYHRIVARGDAAVGLIWSNNEKEKAKRGGRGY